jgi:2-polyprenyl-6-methoxyphenol hydroxylase-like FAD-dependent oxidoreductase
MAKVSVIGAGPAGLIFAYALLRKGYDVTVYSDRTPDQWLHHSTPTGTAFLYGEVIDIERQLGMDHWADNMFGGDGVHLDFKPTADGDTRIEVAGRFKRTGGAIDQRLRVHRWLEDLEANGGKLVIESVTPERADEIAQQSDLTVLAAGKADLGKLIPRDAARSVYDKPQRQLAMCIVEGVKGWDSRVDFTPVKFYFYGDTGEFFWVPYTHKTAGNTWCVLFEAKAGGKLDRFRECQSAGDVVARSLETIRDLAPWDYDLVKDMRVIEDDPYSWLKGAFPPTVRQAYGRLPSGKLIMPIGDTAIAFDPIGGQGGNCAGPNAKYTADAVIAQGDGPFDAAWMEKVNAGFWDYHGKAAYTFNNILLEPLTEAGGTVLMEAAKDRAFADKEFFGNFSTPNNFFPWMEDAEKARQVIADFHALAK